MIKNSFYSQPDVMCEFDRTCWVDSESVGGVASSAADEDEVSVEFLLLVFSGPNSTRKLAGRE